MNIKELMKAVAEKNASDLHLCAGLTPMMRLNGSLQKLSERVLTGADIEGMLEEIVPAGKGKIIQGKEMDLAVEIAGFARFRANIYHDKRGACAAFRLIANKIKPIAELGLPDVVSQAAYMHRGLVLITGVTGSGKSTTLAAIIDRINSERNLHIITIEDPIEYVHEHKKSIVNQREVGSHTGSFSSALRAALREDPDVILVGELRDLDTMSMAITAAETGHLVFATIHTRNTVESVNRIIDVFPVHQQDQIRIQLAESLTMVVSQLLLPSCDGMSRHLASEVLLVNDAVRNLIREKHTHQIRNAIFAGVKDGMQSLDHSLKSLVEQGKITKDAALRWAVEKTII